MTKFLLAAMLTLTVVSQALAQGDASAESKAAELVKHEGRTVVHLWAPWCGNCLAELKSGGWGKMVKENPDVRFVFVSIWNEGDDGTAMLTKYEIAGQPNVTILADAGPRRGENKLKRFLDLPVTWIPTTWVFKGGEMRYALNYGEVRFDVLQQFLTDTVAKW
jgi:thiol-disulfide isomerase/thioredoxin